MRPFGIALALVLANWSLGAQAPDPQTRKQVEWLIYEAPQQWFGNTRDSIVTKLGRPTVMSHRLTPNPDSLATDTVFTLQYDSASFDVYKATLAEHEFLVEATVTGSRYLRASPLPIGISLSRVRAYFGDLSKNPTSQVTYRCTWCDNSVKGVNFWFRDGRLAGAKWEYEID